MDIISKRDGPRREDVQAKRLLSENGHVIRKLADQISNGGYTAMQRARAEAGKTPQPEGLIIHDLGRAQAAGEIKPYIKVSLNNRVVMADLSSGKQLHMLGEIRGRRFVIASAENGFISPLDDEIAAAICDLQDTEISRGFSEKDLAKTIGERLGLGST